MTREAQNEWEGHEICCKIWSNSKPYNRKSERSNGNKQKLHLSTNTTNAAKSTRIFSSPIRHYRTTPHHCAQRMPVIFGTGPDITHLYNASSLRSRLAVTYRKAKSTTNNCASPTPSQYPSPSSLLFSKANEKLGIPSVSTDNEE
jgi:hypothetical protein